MDLHQGRAGPLCNSICWCSSVSRSRESPMNTSKWTYTKGLHDLGNGCYAYLQPDGSWGWSNAGLIVDHGASSSMLVDTLFDLKLTREMLATMRKAERAASNIGTVVNTHSNGDHVF